MKLVLKDSSEIELVNFTSNSFIFLCGNQQEFNTIWSKMTPENLSRVHITNDGVTILTLENLTSDGVQATYNVNKTITGYFYFHGQEYVQDELSEEDREYAAVGRILLGEETDYE